MRGHVLAPFLLLILSTLPACQGSSARQSPPVLSLCQLVGNWRDYHGKQVRVRAIYRVGPEQAWLYDPACRNGDGLTSVPFFREDVKGPLKKLHQLVAKDSRRRAWVVLEGVFHGPEPYGDKVDPKLPEPIRERLEKAPWRYGHMGLESEIDVTKVVEATKVPADVP